MPSPYRNDLPRLKAEIVARVEGGAGLKAVCAPRGAPSVTTVARWARADPLFAAELATAKRRGAWRRLWLFDEARAAAFLARARAGETVRSLWGRPGMPTRGEYFRWKTAQPSFAGAMFALLQRRDAQIGAHGRARRRGFDQTVADQILVRFIRCPDLSLEALLKADSGLPCWETLMRWRREQPVFDRELKAMMARRRRLGRPVPPARIDEVCDHIVQGGTFLSYSRTPGGPSRGTLRRWMRDPAFADAVARACALREEMLQDRMSDYALGVPPGPIRQMERAIGPMKRRIAQLRKRPRKPLWPTRRGGPRVRP